MMKISRKNVDISPKNRNFEVPISILGVTKNFQKIAEISGNIGIDIDIGELAVQIEKISRKYRRNIGKISVK